MAQTCPKTHKPSTIEKYVPIFKPTARANDARTQNNTHKHSYSHLDVCVFKAHISTRSTPQMGPTDNIEHANASNYYYF